jgi:ATP-binding cassette subfamily F protein 3
MELLELNEMIHFTDVSKNFGNQVLYKNASLQINAGDKIGLVGPNGAGKSTIFRIIVGEEGIDSGSFSRPDRLRIGYFSQDVGEMKGRSVLSEVLTAGGDIENIQSRIQQIETELSDPDLDEVRMTKILEEYGELQSQFERMGGYNIESRAKEILTGLGIAPEDHLRPVESFSGGWKMRVALAKILLQEPDLLLMDEPTNHLDVESIIWLENWLMEFKGALVMTSHDRDFLNRLVSKIIEVSNKLVTTYTGNYDFYERERVVRIEQLKAAHSRQQDMLAKEEEFIARFAARASHAAQVQSRVKKLDKIDRIEIPPEESTIHFEFPVPPRGGDEVAKFTDLGKIWNKENGTEKVVFNGASGLVRRLDRVAVVGVNGAGKSTLLKILAGEDIVPTSGVFQIGNSISMGYFSQNSLEVLDPESTIYDEVHSRIPTAGKGMIHNLLGAFKFSGDDVEKKIKILSGGEKSRVVLATILAQPVNFLILDEPTNHLDIKSKEILLAAIKNFQGTVLLVSHDRYFLRSIVNRVFELDQNKLQVYDGDYEYYLWKKASYKI